jgi:hypothetical protein
VLEVGVNTEEGRKRAGNEAENAVGTYVLPLVGGHAAVPLVGGLSLAVHVLVEVHVPVEVLYRAGLYRVVLYQADRALVAADLSRPLVLLIYDSTNHPANDLQTRKIKEPTPQIEGGGGGTN